MDHLDRDGRTISMAKFLIKTLYYTLSTDKTKISKKDRVNTVKTRSYLKSQYFQKTSLNFEKRAHI